MISPIVFFGVGVETNEGLHQNFGATCFFSEGFASNNGKLVVWGPCGLNICRIPENEMDESKGNPNIPLEHTPDIPKPPNERNSFINCWLGVWGMLQGSVGKVLE